MEKTAYGSIILVEVSLKCWSDSGIDNFRATAYLIEGSSALHILCIYNINRFMFLYSYGFFAHEKDYWDTIMYIIFYTK